jgi:hypothetical protein
MGCLQTSSTHEIILDKFMTYFFASNHIFPSSLGKSGMIRSSAKNKPCSRRSCRLVSNGLNFPLSFSSPTTRAMNLIPSASSLSLYSRWGSLVIRHIGVVRGSTIGYLMGLETHHELQVGICSAKRTNAHPEWFELPLRLHTLRRNDKPDIFFRCAQ